MNRQILYGLTIRQYFIYNIFMLNKPRFYFGQFTIIDLFYHQLFWIHDSSSLSLIWKLYFYPCMLILQETLVHTIYLTCGNLPSSPHIPNSKIFVFPISHIPDKLISNIVLKKPCNFCQMIVSPSAKPWWTSSSHFFGTITNFFH